MKLIPTLLEKTTVKAASSPEELEYLQRAADFLANRLDIDGFEILVTFDPPYDLDKSQDGATIGLGKPPKKIFVLVDKNLSTGEKVRTLAHEMIHAQQLAQGRLVITSLENGKISGEWEGQEYDHIKYSRANPWEVEAHTHDKELQRLVVSELGNFLD
jgi:hypothetical protein